MDSTNSGAVIKQRGVVTRISIGLQTDWRHEDECTQDYSNQETPNASHKTRGLTTEQRNVLMCSKYPEDGLQQTCHESVPKNMKSELEISPDNEVLDSLSKEAPQTPPACQGENEEPLTTLDKIPSSRGSDPSDESLQSDLNICRERCWQIEKLPVTSDQRANSVEPEEAGKISKISLEGAAVTTKETVTDRDPAVHKDQRLKGLEFKSSSDRQTPKAGHKQASASLHNRLPDDAWIAMNEDSFPEIEILHSNNTFSFNGKHTRKKRTTPLVKRYKNGQTFMVIFPDGTGQVCYPSGRLAILLSATQSADWSCGLVLEDKHLQPHIQAIFTTGGQGTCYHDNGTIWVNVTPWGGTYCSDTGELKKQWSWLDKKHHVHAPPCRPLCVTLSRHLNIRIQSQEHINITFTSGQCNTLINVGAEFKVNKGKGLIPPGPDMLQRYVQQKSAEINVLLQNIQFINDQKTVSPQKVKPQQSLISQMERRRLPMKRQQSAKKTP